MVGVGPLDDNDNSNNYDRYDGWVGQRDNRNEVGPLGQYERWWCVETKENTNIVME